MKFVAKCGILSKALEPAIGVATRGVLKDKPEYNRLTLEVKSTELIVSAFGGKLGCQLSISDLKDQKALDLDCKTDGVVTVTASDLIKTLSSYPDESKVSIELSGQVVIVKRVDKTNEDYQEVAIFKDPVSVPSVAKNANKEVTIKRTMLIEGIRSVLWSCAFEENKEVLYNWRLTVSKNLVRFAAGTAGIFSILNITGKAAKTTTGTAEFLVHKEQTAPILTVIESATDEDVVIRQSDQDKDTPAQVVFQLENCMLIFVGIDTSLKYPPVDDVIERKPEYRIKTKVADWEYPTKGLAATYTEEIKKQHDMHESDVHFDLDKNAIFVTSRTGVKSHREIPIIEIVETGNKKKDLVYRCQTTHLGDIANRLPKDENITFQFLELQMKPIVAVCEEHENKSWGAPETVKTQQIIIFATIRS